MNEGSKEYRWIGILAVALLALCVTGIANAQVPCAKVADNKAHACWAAPATHIDGSPIVLAITYTVQRQSGTTWVNEPTGTNISTTDWVSPVLAPGTYTYRVFAMVGGQAGEPTTAASKAATTPPNPPGTPAGFVIAQVTIEIVAPAFKVVREHGRTRAGDFVALVPVGRDCSGPVLFRKNGYSFRQVVLTASDSTWQDAGPAPRTAAAPCVRLGG